MHRHIGASLKDLGKKCFALSRMEMKAEEMTIHTILLFFSFSQTIFPTVIRFKNKI